MSYEIINVGELPNDGTGDPVRVAFIKINNNFSQISDTISPSGNEGSLQFKNVVEISPNVFSNTLTGSSNLTFISSTNTLNLEGKLVPLNDGNLELGANDKRISNLFLTSDALKIGNINVSANGNNLTFSVAGSNVGPNFNFGNLNVSSNISYSNSKFAYTVATTTTDGPNSTILSIQTSEMRTGIFNITSRRADTNDSQTATIEVQVDNLGLYPCHTVYGTIFKGNVLTKYDVSMSSGNVELKVSPLFDATITHFIDYKITK